MKTTCLYCEKEYDTKRETSCYCSNSCRTGSYKLRKKNEQIKAARQLAAQAQKEKDDQQKQIEAELRIQNAARRKKAKEDKALKTSQENVKIINESSQVEAEKPSTEHPPEDFPKPPEKPEIRVEPKKHYSAAEVRRKYEAPKRTKFDYWGFLAEFLKAYIDNNRIK